MSKNVAKYEMYVFNDSGKFYTSKEIYIDMYKNFEIRDNIKNGNIGVGYDDKFRVFIPHVDNDVKYSIPFYISPDNPNT